MPEVQTVKEQSAITSIKQWLKAATQKRNLNNPAFLKETRQFLSTYELRSEVLPILQSWDKAPITNKAIESIYKVLVNHHSAKLLEKSERVAESSNWTVYIWGSRKVLDGPKVLLDMKRCKTGWEAEQWADRHLIDCPSDAYAVIDSHTEKTKLTVYRQDAMARREKRVVPCATTDQIKLSKARLSWGVGGQYNKRFYFSRG